MTKILKLALAWLVCLALVSCGGGGGSSGSSVFPGANPPATPVTPVTPAATSVDVLASAVQLGSSSGDEITVTAVVKGPGNVGLAGAPVAFSADSGNLTSAATVTDATGSATATLSAGSDKTNRKITVTATSGTASGSIVVPVVATTASPTAAATAIDVLASAVQLGSGGDQVTISAIVKGAGQRQSAVGAGVVLGRFRNSALAGRHDRRHRAGDGDAVDRFRQEQPQHQGQRGVGQRQRFDRRTGGRHRARLCWGHDGAAR